MRDLQVGDIVEWTGGESVIWDSHVGHAARISRIWLDRTGKVNSVAAVPLAGDLDEGFRQSVANDGAWDAGRFRLLLVAVDPAKVKQTRAGWPVANITQSDDLERPISAEVFIGRDWRTLTFLPDGHFYKYFDQDLDLVEAK